MQDRIPEISNELNTGKPCHGKVRCIHCGRNYGDCSELEYKLIERYYSPITNPGKTVEEWEKEQMDLSSSISGNKRPKMEQRDWMSSDDLPKKGTKKFKIDAVRQAKKNKTGALCYVDLSAGKIKRVMSLRKGFTLDNFVEELGANTDKWIGKSITLERGGSEGQYVNVAQ